MAIAEFSNNFYKLKDYRKIRVKYNFLVIYSILFLNFLHLYKKNWKKKRRLETITNNFNLIFLCSTLFVNKNADK
jgi:hypothetical protein